MKRYEIQFKLPDTTEWITHIPYSPTDYHAQHLADTIEDAGYEVRIIEQTIIVVNKKIVRGDPKW